VAVSPDPSRHLRWLIRVSLWLPPAAVVVLLGIAVGWRIPAGIGVLYLLLILVAMIDRTRRGGASRWLRHDKTLAAATAVVGGMLGATIFGGLGFVFGAVAALALGIGAFVPLSVKNEDGDLVPYDERNASQTATVWKSFGLFLLIGSILTAALWLVVAVTGR
jgi:hypothetical protein